MKWFTIISLIVLSVMALADFYAFEDGILYTQEIEDGWVIPDGARVISVDTSWWRVEGGRSNWWDVLESSKLNYVGKDLKVGKYEIVSKNPLIFKSVILNECFVKINDSWFSFQCRFPKNRVLRVPERSTATLFSTGGWSAVYRLSDDVLTFYADVKTTVPIVGTLHLVSGRYFEKGGAERPIYKAMMAPQNAGKPTEKIAERRIYDVGDVNLPAGENVVSVYSGMVRDTRKVYFVSFYVGSSSGWKNPRFAIEIENTYDNGLGYPMPDGTIHVFQKGVPIGNFTIEGAPKGGTLRILENEVNDMKVRQIVTSSKKTKDGYVRNIRLEYENYGESRTLVVKISGKGLKFIDGDIEPSESADDYLVFEIDTDTGVGSVNLTLKSSW